ncbi:MAG: hypothetical protein AAB842_01100 [Patescibacteria group bacterium]
MAGLNIHKVKIEQSVRLRRTLFLLFRHFQQPERFVVPVIVSRIIVDIGKATVIGIATVQAILIGLKKCLFSSLPLKIDLPKVKLFSVFYIKTSKQCLNILAQNIQDFSTNNP